MIKMENIEQIRKKHFIEGLSARQISKDMGIHRNTVKKHLEIETVKPPKYKSPQEQG